MASIPHEAVRQFLDEPLKPIRTGSDYKDALEKLTNLEDSGALELDREYVNALALLVEDYERRHWPPSRPDPIVMIKVRMHDKKYSIRDLADKIGVQASHLSEAMNQRRGLSLKMIRGLARELSIEPGILLEIDPTDQQLAKS